MTLEEEDRGYPDALRATLQRLDLECRDGLQLIGRREELGFAGSGTIDGQPVVVRFARASGRDHWTGVLIESPLALDLGLTVEPKGFLRSASHITIDHDAFNAEYDVTGDEPQRVQALLDGELAAAIVALGALGGDVRLRDTRIDVAQTWGFLEVEPTLRGIARVAGLCQARTAALPPPAELAGALESWSRYAEAHGLTLARGPLRLTGGGIAARAMRTSPTRYETQVSVALAESLDAGLSLRKAGKLEPYVELVTGRDLQFDDGPFDRTFAVHAEKPERVRAAFDEKVRGLLLELAELGTVGFNDHGVSLSSTRHAEVPTAIDAMLEIVSSARQNLRGSAYR